MHLSKLQYYRSLADKVSSNVLFSWHENCALPQSTSLLFHTLDGWCSSPGSAPRHLFLKRPVGDLSSPVFIQRTEHCKLSSSHYLLDVRGSNTPTSHFLLYIHHVGVHLRIQRQVDSSQACPLMVLEIRSWIHRLGGVRKRADVSDERRQINTQFLTLWDSSASSPVDGLKGFFAACPHGTCLEWLPFSPHPFRPVCGGFQLEHHSLACSVGWLIYCYA